MIRPSSTPALLSLLGALLVGSLPAQSASKKFSYGAEDISVDFRAAALAQGDRGGTSISSECEASASVSFELFGVSIALSSVESRSYAAASTAGRCCSATRRIEILEETEYVTSTSASGTVALGSVLAAEVHRERVTALPGIAFSLGPIVATLECSVGTAAALQTGWSIGTASPYTSLGGTLEANAGYVEADASIRAGVKVLGFEVIAAEFGVRAELDLGNLALDVSLKDESAGTRADVDYALAAVHLELYVHARIRVVVWTREWEELFFARSWGVVSGALL